MRRRGNEKINLDELASGRLPERIITAIGEMELTIEELMEWQESKSTLRFTTAGEELIIEIRAHIPMKKALAILGGVGCFLWAAINFILRYLPMLQAFFRGGQPGA